MKIKNVISICLLLSLFTIPAFSQTADVTEGCAPLNVNFTPPAGVSSYYWDFGDGNTSTVENPVNSYTNPGTYTVIFRETINGNPIGTPITITAYAAPQLTLAASDTSGCAPLTVTFTPTLTLDPGVSLITLKYTFGDGESVTVVNTNPITHTYVKAGTYQVLVELSTSFGQCDLSIQPFMISVFGEENVDFTTTPDPPTACVGPLEVTFNNLTPGAGSLTFLWDFDNGNTSTEINPPAQTYTDGTYLVTLTAFDAGGCESVEQREIRVGPPSVDFEFVSDTICIGDSVILTNLSEFADNYLWDFGPGATPQNSVARTPTNVVFNQGGFIGITLTIIVNGCSNSITKQLFVDDPDASFTADPTFSCTGELTTTFTPNNLDAVSYLWMFSDSTMSMEQMPTHTIVNMDTTIYSINGLIRDTTYLTVVNPSGCSATLFFVDTIYQPNALFAPDIANGCAPITVTFEDQSTADSDIVLWEWDYGDGTQESFPTSTDPAHTYNTAGEYLVQLIITTAAGCKDTSFLLPIEVGGALSPDFTVDKTDVCPGDTVTLTPTAFPGDDMVDAWHFDTDDSRSFHCFQNSELEWQFVTNTGDFDVTLYVEYNGCISQITKSDLITVNGPIADLDYLIECDDPYTVDFTDISDDATALSWSLGDGTDTLLTTFSHTYPDTGTYVVVLTAENPGTGCPASTDTAIINIRDIHAEFEPLDSLLCLGNMYNLDAALSRNVDDRCWRGYTWYFSDPNDRPITTSEVVTEHVFESPGLNDVTLITRDINGCLDTFTQQVKVFGVYPAFNISDDTICLGQLVNFIDLSTADTLLNTWEWNFGGSTSDQINPSHTFPFQDPAPPFVTVTLNLTDTLGCGGMLSADIPVYQPISEITALPSINICLGDEINFSATDYTDQGSFLIYDWDFGDGQTSTNSAEIIEYMAPGNYDVVLQYTEDATGCPGPDQTLTVSVQDYPIAAFTTDVDPNNVICSGTSVEFTNTSTVTAGSEPLTYLWEFGDGNSTTTESPTYPFNNGTFTITLTATTSNGCSNVVTQDLEFDGPLGDLTTDPGIICFGDEITFTLENLESVDSWEWILPNGASGDPSQTSIVFSYDPNDAIPLNGIDTIKVTLFGGPPECSRDLAQAFEVVVADASVMNIDSTICLGDLVGFSTDPPIGNTQISWEFGNGQSSSAFADTLPIYSAGGNYTVTLTVSNPNLANCNAVNTQEVLVIDQVSVNPISEVVCPGDPVRFPITGIQPYHTLDWTANPSEALANLMGQDADNPIASANSGTTSFFLEVSDPGGCFASRDTFTLEILSEAFTLPNAFTPDLPENTTFNLVPGVDSGLENITITQFQVFNRWGQKVYDNDTPATGWDGTQNGNPAASDVYLYNIVYSIEGCEAGTYRGNVTLIR